MATVPLAAESRLPLSLPPLAVGNILPAATPQETTGGKRGPVAKRRFQRGSFQLKDRAACPFYYEDCQQRDGTLASRKVRHFIGHVGPGGISERAARREHSRIMDEVNIKRGSVAPAVPGRAFVDSVAEWRAAIAPHLSPATVRQRESYPRKRVLPKFKDAAPHTLDVAAMQQFATELRKTLSRKAVINILGAIFSILDYAGRTGTRVLGLVPRSLPKRCGAECTGNRLKKILESKHDLPASRFADALLYQLSDWSQHAIGTGQTDDLTVLAIDFQ